MTDECKICYHNYFNSIGEGMKRPNAHPKTVAQRREEGEERQAHRETLSPFQQIVVLDNRLGIGKGPKRSASAF